jgi:hypothetical protein
MDSELRSGDIMFSGMDGIVPGLFPVGAGQVALFLTRRWWRMVRSIRQWFHIRHVAVVHEFVDGARIVQAMPRGVECVSFQRSKHWTPGHVYIRPDWEYPSQGRDMAYYALSYLGTPYNFLTYLKLAAGAFRMRLTEGWLRRHMSTRRDMMCSQHVDQSLADAGYRIFDDGRLPQDVVPAELFDALIRRPGWFLIPGHATFGQWTDNTFYPGIQSSRLTRTHPSVHD